MKQRGIGILLCLVLLLSIPVVAAGEDVSVQLAAAYRTEYGLVSFLKAENIDGEFKVRVSEIGTSGDSAQARKLINMSSEMGVSFVLLVDASSSMKGQIETTATFAATLLQSRFLNSRVLVVPYTTHLLTDKVFDSAAYDSTTEAAQQLIQAIGAIPFAKSDNRTSDCIVSAIAWIQDNIPAQIGDLVNLIVISDPEGRVLDINSVEKGMVGAPEILFHSVQLGEKPCALRTGGIHTVINGTKSPIEAASEIESFLTGLYKVILPWEEGTAERTAVKMYATIGVPEENMLQTISVSADSVALLIVEDGVVRVKTPPPPVDEGEAEQRTDINQIAEEGVNQQDEPSGEEAPDAEQPAEGEEEAAPAEDQPEQQEECISLENAETEEKSGVKWLVLSAIGAAVLLLLLLFAFLVARRRSKVRPYAILMKLDVLSGNCRTRRAELYLYDQLLIGRDRKCDIVFKDVEVSRRNTRVFVRDGIVFVEDLNSASGTALEGMRIYAPNRLRSGDEISIGSVAFRLQF